MIRPKDRAGFTLVELMVGMTLLGILLTGVYTVTVGTWQARARINEMSSLYTAGPRILKLIAGDLSSAFLYGIEDGKALKAQRQFVGGEQVTILDLVVTTNSKSVVEVDDRILHSDITEIGYRLRTNDDFPDLLELYRREDFFLDDEPLKGGKYHLVYDRVRSLVIDFYEPVGQGKTTSSIASEEGKEAWDSEDEGALPRAARITLELGPPEGVYADLESDTRRYKFVRWVLFPTAGDRAPEQDQDSGPGPR